MIKNENNSKKQLLFIGNILKDLKDIEVYLPNIIHASIAGKKLKFKRKQQNENYMNMKMILNIIF